MRAALALAIAVSSLAWAPHAAACGSPTRPWVSVDFADGPWPAKFRSSVLGDLAAGLSRRGIDACSEGNGPSSAPLAAVRITRETPESVAVAVEVRDAVTQKRVGRDVDLSNVPEDGRSFAIALAVDELVWASWAELGLRHRRPLPKQAPPEVIVGVEKELPKPEPPPARVGVRVAAERFLGGQTHLGGDVALVLPPLGRFQFNFALGYRHGLEVPAPHGSVSSYAVGLGGDVRYLLIRETSVELGFGIGTRAAWVRFAGKADPPASSAKLEGVSVYARSGLSTAVRVGGGTWLELGASSGLPLRALEATDGDTVVAGVSGVEIAGYLGVALEL
ncbi:MAG TPA: hypothetical protein VGK73_16950 [Polyangiaceae bacterium]